jgi:hypothetical protein
VRGKERTARRENAKMFWDHADLALEDRAKVKDHLGMKPVVSAEEETSTATSDAVHRRQF